MKNIVMCVVARVEDELYGTVPDDIWEKYQNGEITDFYLYSHYFKENESNNLEYQVTEINAVEEEGDEE